MPDETEVDPEVTAAGACVAALKPLRTTGRYSYVAGQSDDAIDTAAVRRVLNYLTERFGVDA